MIGHFLSTLTPELEERVLTEELVPWPEGAIFSMNRCLVVVASDGGLFLRGWPPEAMDGAVHGVARRFDALSRRFGALRVGAAIRTRILANQARRTLTAARSVETVRV